MSIKKRRKGVNMFIRARETFVIIADHFISTKIKHLYKAGKGSTG
jgi:hypothetical protein